MRDLTNRTLVVHFAYATPQDAREAVRLAERLIANVVVITPHRRDSPESATACGPSWSTCNGSLEKELHAD